MVLGLEEMQLSSVANLQMLYSKEIMEDDKVK